MAKTPCWSASITETLLSSEDREESRGVELIDDEPSPEKVMVLVWEEI